MEKLGHQERTEEFEVGEWRRSIWTLAFWTRTILTLGLYVPTLWRMNKITLTSRRITQRRGDLIGGSETTISLDNITDIFIDVPPLGAIFNWGNIDVQTAGSGDAEINFDRLANAKKLREVIYDLKDGKLDEVMSRKTR